MISAFSGVTTWEWTYDDSGNILTRKEYNGSTLVDTVNYSYTDASWGDLLTACDGVTIQYDAIGNPSYDGNWHFFWKHGRQLEAMVGSNLISFSYDANGMRKTKTVDSLTYTYLYNGGQLTQMTRSDGNTLLYTYDTFGHPATVNWNGTVYYIVTNLQGDVISIRTSAGDVLVWYQYDPWGKILSITGSMATTLGTLNPLTYRGYVYDHETGLYYLQSRYYNPEWGRFLNADALVSTGGLLGNNMYSYCWNTPVNNTDYSGTAPQNVFFEVCYGGCFPKEKQPLLQLDMYILEAGLEFNVDPAMIATVIAVERLNNVNIMDLADVPVARVGIDTSIGVGQVRVSTARMLEEKGYIEGSRNNWDRIGRLSDKKTNVRYVAAYLAYLRDIWVPTCPDFESRPDIWWTTYNTGHVVPKPDPKSGDHGDDANMYYAFYNWLYR